MSSFTSDLITKIQDDGSWRLQRSFTYYFGSKESDYKVVINRGFITDFASIPSFLWSVLHPVDPDYAKASVVHDYLYRHNPVIFSKKVSDAIFFEAMEVLNAPKWKKWILYLAVCFFGRSSWNKSRSRGRNK